ncbi:alpha,alpha-phosphotrehalase [Rothia sp. ZJ1223]|uniref:alpha,alpha-phosphotrehalase n=1 Tax=Rothia sp. ZJ1223 TaxID=2811098 RepID=UPI0019572450|nr:alpha,alpha-phosphotrehalase [Rothia sp. ZJ1223]MBM7052126.1 alpha,alpha-phosphotrehalase [Rothia sp. ZJ1223]
MSFADKVIYQIYPKSFYDSTGSGVGDLRGVIEKVSYIASLGVDMVWFNPFFASPQKDNGYDISNYYAIEPSMGTMSDLEELIAALDEHGIGVMFDMVFNHVSTEHEWFQRALAGEKEYQDFFYLQPAQVNGSLPTNWKSKFGGPAWEPFGDTNLYYLHLYDVSQADLNWHNPRVRQELFNVVNFWRDKGVRGFRFDVINVIGKDEVLLDAPEGTLDKLMYTDTPRVHTWVKEMNRASFGNEANSVTVGELSSTTIENGVLYSAPARDELSMIFSFHHLKVDYDAGNKWSRVPFDFEALKGLWHGWAEGVQAGNGWNALFLNNHDQPRALNRFGDVEAYRVESATMLAAAVHLSRGTPYIYMGEEIGMVDPVYSSMDDYVDVEAHNAFATLRESGLSEAQAFEVVVSKARDNSRTPMQWDASAHAGFTSGTPWLGTADYAEINVEAEQREGKILPFYKKLIALRHEYPVISRGRYTPWVADHRSVYAFTRQDGEGSAATELLVLNNFYGEATDVSVPERFIGGQVLISNYSADAPTSGTYRLLPYQTLAVLIQGGQ